tara:strand:+ start:317 stop:1426 length:1110 start_codon:yes stop_codon:yes gene_type:complete
MKRILIPLIASLALPTTVSANVDPEVHKLCKDVSDYVGCIEANSNSNSSVFKKSNKNIKNKFFTTNDRAKVEQWKKENFDPSKQASVGYIYAWADDDSGIYAIKVFSSGAAGKAGLKESSLITYIDDQKLSEADAETVNKLYLGGRKLTGIYKGKNFTKTLKDFSVLNKKGMKEFDYYMAQTLRLESGLEGDIDYIVLPEIKENIKKNLSDYYAEKRAEYLESLKDFTIFEGKKILASRLCPQNENMYWMNETYKGKTSIKEMGCMTKKENETYWRDYETREREREYQQREIERQNRQRALQNLSDTLKNLGNTLENNRREYNNRVDEQNKWIREYNRDQQNYQQQRDMNRSLDRLNRSVDKINNKLGY